MNKVCCKEHKGLHSTLGCWLDMGSADDAYDLTLIEILDRVAMKQKRQLNVNCIIDSRKFVTSFTRYDIIILLL